MVQRSKSASRLAVWLISAFLFLSMIEFFMFSSSAGTLLKYFQMGCLVIMVVLVLSSSKKVIRISSMAICLLALAFVLGLSLVWTEDVSRGLAVFRSCILQIVFILMALQFDYDEGSLRIMQRALALGGLLLAVLMLTRAETYAAYTDRFSLSVDGNTAMDPTNMGGLLALSFAVLLPMTFDKRSFVIFKWAGMVLILVAMLMTGSRGAVLSCAGAVVMALVVQRSFKKKFKFLILIEFVVIAFIAANNKLGWGLLENVIARFEEEGGSGRLEIWSAALPRFWDAPIFGIGLGSSPLLIYRLTGENVGSHNTYITFLLEGGIILLSIVLILYFAIFKRLRKRGCVGALSCLTASFVCSFFVDTYNKKIFWIPLLLCCVAAHIKEGHRVVQGRTESGEQ